MFELVPSSWPIAVDADDPRDQFHRTALADARVTTERRPELTEPRPARAGVMARLRLALTGAPAQTAPCSCPA